MVQNQYLFCFSFLGLVEHFKKSDEFCQLSVNFGYLADGYEWEDTSRWWKKDFSTKVAKNRIQINDMLSEKINAHTHNLHDRNPGAHAQYTFGSESRLLQVFRRKKLFNSSATRSLDVTSYISENKSLALILLEIYWLYVNCYCYCLTVCKSNCTDCKQRVSPQNAAARVSWDHQPGCMNSCIGHNWNASPLNVLSCAVWGHHFV